MKNRFSRWGAFAGFVAASALALTACSGASNAGDQGDGGEVTLEFAQWWQPEANGQLEKLVEAFETENPGIKIELQTGPYGNTKDQLVAGAASGTLPDLIGLDGNWVYDLTKQGVLADLDELMAASGSDLAGSIEGVEVDGATRMLNVVYATYVLFANTDLLAEAEVEVPTTWDEFAAAARAVKSSGATASPTALPLSLESPVGIKNDVLSWYWASEGTFRDGEGADLESDDLVELLDYFAVLNDEGLVAPGLANMQEQDKVEAFASGQTAMIVSATPHVNVIGDQVNFTVGAVPVKDGFSGTPGATYASWGVGIADSSDHKEEALKFVEFMLSAEENGALASAASMFPANPESELDESTLTENSVKAFEIWKEGKPVDEFLGLPAAEQLQRTLIEQVQPVLSGDLDSTQALEAAQVEWDDIIQGD